MFDHSSHSHALWIRFPLMFAIVMFASALSASNIGDPNGNDNNGSGNPPVEITTVFPNDGSNYEGTTAPPGFLGREYSFRFEATGGSGNYAWSLGTLGGALLPAGLTLSRDGYVRGIVSPDAELVKYINMVIVTDALDGANTDQKQFDISVFATDVIAIAEPAGAVLPAGTIAADYDLLEFEGSQATYQGMGPSVGYVGWNWAWTNLPPGMTFERRDSDRHGILSGTPTEVGVWQIEITAFDRFWPDLFDSQPQTFELEVEWQGELSIEPAGLPNALEREYYEVQFEVRGGTGNHALTVQYSDLPSSLEISPDGTLFGTPLLDQAGTYHLDLLAEEPNHASAWVSYEFVIDPDLTPRLRVTTTALDDAVEAASYGPVQLVAENSAGNARWDVSGGRLPPGLVLMGDGRVLGTPYPDTEGAYTFIVSVEEADRIGTTASISMRVNATNRLAILTASLPNAREGASYHVQLSGSGGSGILIWSTSSALPDGLTLYASGLLAGDLRNATAGAYSITIELNDEVDAELYGSASRTLTLVVQASQTEEGDTPAATPPQDINGALLTGAAAGCSFAGHDALGAWWLMATAFFALLVRTSLFKRNSSSS